MINPTIIIINKYKKIIDVADKYIKIKPVKIDPITPYPQYAKGRSTSPFKKATGLFHL